ncbi:MAG: histidine phosphatase family protein [Candidatus Heimdallarchaeota archaeon]|nr:histidine phosphatase family protein [Candidatus Heimdallarchaeota archaeon]MCK4769673.1 histidine phosphatase family protein [Candidatus Heimdallarchaeota archaeon]
MQNTMIFLRHAKIQKNPNSHSEKWILSDEGLKYIEEVFTAGIFDDVDVIISSSQKMCIQTAYFLADRLGKEITTKPDLNEIEKGTELIETSAEYLELAESVLTNYEKSIANWEPANKAYKRYQMVIDRIDSEYNHKKILIVSHGIVMTLYFTQLLKEPLSNLFPRYKSLKQCAWGIVKDNEVTRDITG